jgi:HSP20 family protein
MMVRRPSPFGELISLRRTMDRVFADPFFRPVPVARTGRRMPLDVIDTADALLLEAALPGVRPEDVDISVLGDVLTVTAGSDEESSAADGEYQVREVRRGRVSRSVSLPSGLRPDEASATFEHGLLRLSIPRELPAERRHIPLSMAASSTATEVTDGAKADGQAASPADAAASESTGA